MLGEKAGTITFKETTKPIDSGKYGLPAFETHNVGSGKLVGHEVQARKLPDFELTDLLPCFTIFTSNDDKTIDVAVEKLKLFLLSPPVPQVSIKSSLILILVALFFR